ncbi:hypothetical protein BOTBODRAFT_33813 [Botryobasidium botryosum FD-172 SS1]|uniref:Mucoidy inhibitor A n=1 Tax=Botryobasidium botryosum (strain FD-172 SS1) TaxID=930990 RepID=A0A067MBR6_BOTB1|nr:hypothetical protein BOTBODRAFT_33813 [Botryobasidium botryosum FD-172 SS1]
MTKVSDIDAASASTAVLDTQTNVVKLVSADVSTITNVSLYGSRAEIMRVAKLDLKAGQNRVTITGLPGVMLGKTLRVEGRGSATIHDVTISTTPSNEESFPELEALKNEKKIIESSQYRVSKRLEALESFLTTLSAKDNSIAQVTEVLTGYETEAAALQNQSYDLDRRLTELDRRIGEEENRFRTQSPSGKLNKQVTVAIFARAEGSVELVLIYAVSRATWRAAYDTRVTTANTKDDSTPVDLIYKALINQSTGEDWTDVPIVLETASPTFGLSIPELTPHTLRVYRPQPVYRSARSTTRKSTSFAPPRASSPVAYFSAPSPPSSSSVCYDAVIDQEAMVTSAGNVTATFTIPGRSNIPSDGEDHQVTIAKLKLEARLQWVAVPSMTLQTHLKANIKNASEYTFLPGETSVYLDGSFISNSPVPPVSPEESFDCPLGVDSSIRLTYHPRTTRASKSGFYTKTQTHAYAQRITVFNTRTQPVENVTVLAQVPVSQDSVITVKISKPALPPPAPGSNPGSAQQVLSDGPSGSGSGSGAGTVRVSPSVVAEWEDGQEGRLKWIAKLAPQEKLLLELEWEVSAPVGTSIVGL